MSGCSTLNVSVLVYVSVCVRLHNLWLFMLQILSHYWCYFICVGRKYGKNHKCVQTCSVVLEESVLSPRRVNQPVSVLR